MNDSALAVIEGAPLSAASIRAQVNLIQEVMKAVMKEGTHYGKIPGVDKPSLWKPGAEKLLSTFRILIVPIVEDLSTQDCVRYRVTAIARSMASGIELGSAVGECSSDEKKYKWRGVVCNEEFDATPEDRRRLEWKKGYNNKPPYQVKQVRAEPADIANTVLKMAAKRAEVAVCLRVTAASDIFTQDIEDLPPELLPTGDDAPPAGTVPMPQRASATNGAPAPAPSTPPAETKRNPEEVVLVKDVREREDEKGKKWAIDTEDKRSFLTRYGKLADDAMAAKELDAPVRITYHAGPGGGFVLDSLAPEPDAAPKTTPAA